MELDNIFNGTVLVFWALFLVPDAIKEKKWALLGISGSIILAIEITLSMFYAHRDFPFNFLAGCGIFVTALALGFVVHYFQSKQEKDTS